MTFHGLSSKIGYHTAGLRPARFAKGVNHFMPSEPDSCFLLSVLLTLVCLTLSSLYAAGESAVDFLSPSQVKKDAEDGNAKAKKLAKLVNWQKAAVSPFQAGMALFGFLGFGFCLYAFSGMLYAALGAVGPDRLRHLLAVLLVTAAYLVVFFLFGSLLPQKCARCNTKSFAYRCAGLLWGLQGLALPFFKLCALIVNGILRICGIDPHILDDPVTEEEILQMVGEGEEKGVIEENELDMITNILDFKDTTAEETMTHRTDIIAVEDDAPIAEVVEASVENGCSRIPVYHEDIDTVVGICYIKDLLPYVGQPVPDFIKITDLMRPAYFVPETKKCSQLFTEMTERKVQIAIVLDEYGGTAGLITLEDLVESIVGNIQDEYDHEEEEIHRMSETEFTVDGAASVDEVSDLTGIQLPEGDYDTIAGLVTEQLGRLPKSGEHPQVRLESITITVLEVEDQRIARLLLVKDAKESTGIKEAEQK